MPDPKRERDRLRQQNRQLRAENLALRLSHGWLDPAYAAIIVELSELAIHGVRRPADLGGPVMANHADSRPPTAQPNKAYDLLRKERVNQRRTAIQLRQKMLRLVDGDHADEAPQVGASLC